MRHKKLHYFILFCFRSDCAWILPPGVSSAFIYLFYYFLLRLVSYEMHAAYHAVFSLVILRQSPDSEVRQKLYGKWIRQ